MPVSGPTILQGLLNGVVQAFSPTVVSAGTANSYQFAGLGPDGFLHNSLFKPPNALTYSSTVIPDLTFNTILTCTLTGNITIANPTSYQPGNSGSFVFTQDSTGGRTATFGSAYKFPNKTKPVLTTTANAIDVVYYQVISGTLILCAFSPNNG